MKTIKQPTDLINMLVYREDGDLIKKMMKKCKKYYPNRQTYINKELLKKYK